MKTVKSQSQNSKEDLLAALRNEYLGTALEITEGKLSDEDWQTAVQRLKDLREGIVAIDPQAFSRPRHPGGGNFTAEGLRQSGQRAQRGETL